MTTKQQQRGISLLGFIFFGGVLAFLGLVGAQVVPTYSEYMAVQKAAKKATTGTTVSEVRSIFDKAAQIDDIKSITGQELEIGKSGDQVVVSFAYEREIHLFGPAYLTLKYTGSVK